MHTRWYGNCRPLRKLDFNCARISRTLRHAIPAITTPPFGIRNSSAQDTPARIGTSAAQAKLLSIWAWPAPTCKLQGAFKKLLLAAKPENQNHQELRTQKIVVWFREALTPRRPQRKGSQNLKEGHLSSGNARILRLHLLVANEAFASCSCAGSLMSKHPILLTFCSSVQT